MSVGHRATDVGRASARPRAVGWGLWLLQVLAAVGFTVAAGAKLSADPQAMATFEALGWGAGPRYLLAALELLGAVALLVPPLAGLAALAFVALTVGAVTAQLVTGGSVVMAAVLLVVCAVVAFARRHETTRLLADLRRPGRG